MYYPAVASPRVCCATIRIHILTAASNDLTRARLRFNMLVLLLLLLSLLLLVCATVCGSAALCRLYFATISRKANVRTDNNTPMGISIVTISYKRYLQQHNAYTIQDIQDIRLQFTVWGLGFPVHKMRARVHCSGTRGAASHIYLERTQQITVPYVSGWLPSITYHS